MKFAVTSESKLKIAAADRLLKKILKDPYEIYPTPAESGVKDQPTTLAETKKGAVNRINTADVKGADYVISVESGVERDFDQYYSFTFVAVSNGAKTQFGFGTSTRFPVTDDVQALLEQGGNLCQPSHNQMGLIAHLTNDTMTRMDLIEQALTAALIPFHFFPIPIPEGAPTELTKYSDSLNQIQKSQLATQLSRLNFSPPKVFVRQTADIKTIEPEHFTEDDEVAIVGNARALLSGGQVAVVIMAGGQGSRLGSPYPKALMDIGLPSHQTLLELNLRRIRKLTHMFKENDQNASIPTYILTSEDTHSCIAAYLLQKQNFGLPHVRLVKQPKLPCQVEGKFVLAQKWMVKDSPNGNGAIFEALKKSGAVAEMKQLGVQYVEIHPIDNALAKPADPFFVGAIDYTGSECAIKVVRRRNNQEKVGTVCEKGGKTVVVEYSELPEEQAGEHQWANTAMHCFSLDVIDRAADASLPYHIALKKEKVVGDDGELVEAQVTKFERFIFDAMELCESCCVVEVQRNEEFAPVKNAPGSGSDCPETARDLVLDLHKQIANQAGVNFIGDGPFELLPETSYDGAGADEILMSIESITLPMVL